jgi:hypothetical protein
MKDKELELEETETPHTPGGLGEGRVQQGEGSGSSGEGVNATVCYTEFNRSNRRIHHKDEVWVPKKPHEPV